MAPDPEMLLHCDCRTAGAQSIMITAKAVGAMLKVHHRDNSPFEGFVSPYAKFFDPY
jgi:hypothetical protein